MANLGCEQQNKSAIISNFDKFLGWQGVRTFRLYRATPIYGASVEKENTNGLIRQYFLKGISLETIIDDHVQIVMDRLNNRPRKTLGFKTPIEVFFQMYRKQAASP